MRLNIFALAAIVSVIALALPTQAKIVYRSADIVVNAAYNLDLNHDGIVDFSITPGGYSISACDKGGSVSETSASGNGTIVGPLSLGDPIGPDQTFVSGGVLEYWRIFGNVFKCQSQSGGPWLRVKSGYLGFSLQVAGQTYYGWAKLINQGLTTVALVGYAYEDTPGMAISAGETSYVQFIPAGLEFGKVSLGNRVSGSVTLRNWLTTTLLINNATLTGVNSADFKSENGNPPCGGSVAAGASCTLTFTFTPSIVENEAAIYSVYDDDGVSPQKLQLRGTGK